VPRLSACDLEIIRDFNNYPVRVGGAGESRIDDGGSGDGRLRPWNRQIEPRQLSQAKDFALIDRFWRRDWSICVP
jgi:hypothetical protein